MANLFRIALLLTVNLIFIAADSDNDCKCSEDIDSAEVKEVFEFLSKNNPDQAVWPGELTELVPCRNCIEQNRRKRRIEEEENERKREERSTFVTSRLWGHHHGERNKCPIGHRKIFWRCIKFD